MRGWIRQNRPAIVLAVLSPWIAEVLVGSTKFSLLFFAPLAFFVDFGLLMLMYGGGALLIREACVRWDKGWASVLLLGAAYGIVEEGLAVHTFFQAGGDPVGVLGSFGRFGGVNVLWALGLSVYHSVISIALPILFIELAFPQTRGTSLLARRGVIAVGAGYVGVVALFAVVVPSAPSLLLFAVSLAAIGGLVAAARWVPPDLLRPREGAPSAPWWAFAVAGSLLMVDWLVTGLAGPAIFGSAWLAGSAFVAFLFGILGFVLRYAGTRDARMARYWFAAGMIGFFFAWDFILEFVLVPGILVASVVSGVFLYLLYRRLQATGSQGTPPAIATASGPAG